MDRVADGMIARGPTGVDRETWNGSLHVLDLPDVRAAEAFVADEPYNRAGLFSSHLVRRFGDLLGQTMWEFDAAPDAPRFLVIVEVPDESGAGAPLPDLAPALGDRRIVHGELLALDGTGGPVGVLAAVQAASRDELGALLRGAGVAPGGPLHLEVHDWEFGGRR